MDQISRLFDFPYHQLANFPKADSLVAKIDGQWHPTSTESFIEQANLASRGLLALGIQPGDKIALISNNRPEWHILDIAILQIGAVNVPVYPTISEEDYKFIFNDAGVKMCVVSDLELFTKVNNIINDIESLESIYAFDELSDCKHWSTIKSKADAIEQSEVEKLKDQVKTDDLATLIYTSGTTGKPKGVMLSHQNLVSNVVNSRPRLPVDHNSKSLSFLPVCHVYERMLTYLYMYVGVSTYFAESIDTIGDNLKEVKPDVFTAVPRLLEKVYDKIMTKGKELTGIKKGLFFWAVELGHAYEVPSQSSGWYRFKLSIARKLIFSKWQEALGGNVKAIASGSAALQPRLARVFNAAGIPLFEGYGLTETSPVLSVNCDANDGHRFGTVGRPLDNVTIKIAEDGEILAKGSNVMLGYYNNPTATQAVIDEEGWFHTGDIGEFVDGNFLKITDRKKEIFKTSGGKYVAPQVLENKFKESLFIEQIMVIGENEKHPAALICPEYDFLKSWCDKKGIAANSKEEMANNPVVKKRILREIEQLNSHFGKWEQVKKIELIPSTWSVETEELTPTLKLRRKIILAKYSQLVEQIYRG